MYYSSSSTTIFSFIFSWILIATIFVGQSLETINFPYHFFYYSSHLCFWSLWSSAYISLPSMRGYYSNAFLCVKQSNDRTVCSPTSGSNWCLLSHFLTPFCHPVHTSNEILLWSSHLLKYRDCPTINNS